MSPRRGGSTMRRTLALVLLLAGALVAGATAVPRAACAGQTSTPVTMPVQGPYVTCWVCCLPNGGGYSISCD